MPELTATSKLFSVFSVPFLIAWIYLIIPNTDYWEYNLFKGFYFSVVTTACYAESIDVYYPGLPDMYYNIMYIIAVLFPLILHVIAWFTDTQTIFFLGAIISTSPVLVIVAAYGIFELRHDHGDGNSNEIKHLSTSFEMNPIQNVKDSVKPERYESPLAGVESPGSNSFRHDNIKGEIGAPKSVFASFFKPFEYLPRYLFRAAGAIQPTKLIKNGFHHWLTLCVFLIICNIMYLFSVAVAFYFRRDQNIAGRSIWFQVFVVFSSLIRLALKETGTLLDSFIEPVGYNAMIIGDIVGLFLYYMFYRILFESLKRWSMFFIMQLMHLSSEWLLYTFRASDSYLVLSRRLMFPRSESIDETGLAVTAENAHPVDNITIESAASSRDSKLDLTIKLFRESLAIGFGLRVVNMVCTGIGVIILMITASKLPWVHSTLSTRSSIEMASVFALIAISLTLETINAWLITIYFSKYYKLDIRTLTLEIFEKNPRLQFSVSLVASSLVIVAVVSFTTDAVFHH